MPLEPKSSKPGRRLLRISLRAFLVLLTIVCVVLGMYVNRVHRQRAAVKWVNENGGQVTYENQTDAFVSIPKRTIQPTGPGKWVHDTLGVDYVFSVKAVSFNNFYEDIADFSALKGLEKLENLKIRNFYFNDDNLEQLAPLKNLRVLNVCETQVSDLQGLAGLDRLEILNLDRTQVNDLKPLAGLERLKRLSLQAVPVSDLSALAGLNELEFLDLREARVSELEPLAGLENLRRLNLADTYVGELAPLSGHGNLQALDLGRTQVIDLSPLSGLTSLEYLDITGTEVVDLGPLAGLNELQSLYVSSYKLTGMEVSRLRAVLPSCKIVQLTSD